MIYLTGFHAIEERIRSGRPCGPLLVAKPGPRARTLTFLANEYKIRIDRVGTDELDRLAHEHRGIALEVEEGALEAETFAETSIEEFLESLGKTGEGKDALVVILDEITDPHNYGAILRS